MKKLRIVVYVLSCCGGWVGEEVWCVGGGDEKKGMSCCGVVENDCDVVDGVLEVEGGVVGWWGREKDWSGFDNDGVRLVVGGEGRNGLDMMQKGCCCMVDERFVYEK